MTVLHHHFGFVESESKRSVVEDDLAYRDACIEFLYACFNDYPRDTIKARAERMRELRGKV